MSNVSTIAVELQDLKKQRRTDEKRIRQKVMEEYDEVVKELVHELHKIQDRFNEYRVDTLNEVMGIMSETKKEELKIVVDKMDVPLYMKQSAENAIKQETSLRRMNEENHELKMTVKKPSFTNNDIPANTEFKSQLAPENAIHVYRQGTSASIGIYEKGLFSLGCFFLSHLLNPTSNRLIS